VYAFPNPVRPDYDGLIAIRGLARDAIVKITDIRGQVLYETKALGGQAIWDGKDLNGQQAATGVYLVFSTAASDGFNKPDALVTKILVVK
ncbi:MAG: regulator, partial [Saprospiraceae bacterium]